MIFQSNNYQPSPSSGLPPKKNSKKVLGINIFILSAILLLVLLLTLDYFKVISLSKLLSSKPSFSIPFLTVNSGKQPSEIIAKVGNEYIYQKDLDSEIQNYPEIKNVDRNKLLLDKLIKDSIILQGAQADGIVKLDGSVFNSLQKNYQQRLNLIIAVKQKIDLNSDSLSGVIVSLWFYNRAPGRVGYGKGRQIASATITKLHDEVIDKQLTIQQAGQAIQNDPNLGNVDPAYLSNALLEFNRKPAEPVVFDPGFDKIIKQLKVGEVSDVYLAKTEQWDHGKPTDTAIDSVFMFAQVTARKKTNIASFDDWVNQKTKLYAVIIY